MFHHAVDINIHHVYTQEHYRQAQTICIEFGNADSCVEASATKGYMSATCGDTQQTDTSTPSITTTDQDYASSSNADMQRVIKVTYSFDLAV